MKTYMYILTMIAYNSTTNCYRNILSSKYYAY